MTFVRMCICSAKTDVHGANHERRCGMYTEPRPAYEDLELHTLGEYPGGFLDPEPPLEHGYIPRPLWAGTCERCGARAGEGCAVLYGPERRPGIHPAVIRWLFIAVLVVLVVIAAALFIRGAS